MKSLIERHLPVSLTIFLFTLIFIFSLTLKLDAEAHPTPANFMFNKQTRISTKYMTEVLQNGEAATLIDPLKQIHAELKNGQHHEQLAVIRHNNLSLISLSENMIASQEFSDNIADESLLQEDIANLQRNFRATIESEFPGTEITEEVFTPAANDRVYNEKKKDLLEVAYAIQNTLNER